MASAARRMRQAQKQCAKMVFTAVKPYIYWFTHKEKSKMRNPVEWETRYQHFGSYQKQPRLI